MTIVHANLAKLIFMELLQQTSGRKNSLAVFIRTNEHKWGKETLILWCKSSPSHSSFQLKRPTLHLVLQNLRYYFWNDACKIRCLIQTWKPKLDLLTFSTETRFCPLCQELNHKFPLKFSLNSFFVWFCFVCFSALSSSKLASDENCCCFALIQFSLKDECSLPSVEFNMIKRKDCVPFVLVERLSKECCNHRLIF